MINHYIARGGKWVSRTVTPPPPPPPPANVDVTPWLPFDMPKRETLATSPRQAFAHYFTPYPISINNSTNYYEARWLPPGTVEGTTDHRITGGFVRDEPLLSVGRTSRTGTNWADLDKADEIRQAISCYLDGFVVDGLNYTDRLNQERQLMRGWTLVNDPYFKLIPMPDGTSSGTADLIQTADVIAEYLKHPSSFKFPNGTQPIAPYAPERAPKLAKTWGPAGWQQIEDRLRTVHGLNPVWWFCYLDTWNGATTANAFDAMAYGHGRWGDASYGSAKSNTVNNGLAAYTSHNTYAKPWMTPVRVQDTRPNAANHKWWEAWNTELFRTTWMHAINGPADWVQIPTWNDYSEHAHIAPSRNHGYFWLDINCFYLAWWKTGTPPTITRDAIYLSHRVQPTSGTTYTSTLQTLFQTQQDTTSSPAKNDVEALCFLKAPAIVSITVGGTTTTFDSAKATPVDSRTPNVFSFKVPLQPGNVSAKAVRSGITVTSVATTTPVSTTQISEDLHYRAASSRR